MSQDGDPAPNRPADNEDHDWNTLRSCRERLRAAVQLLFLDDPDLTAEVQQQARARIAGALRELEAAEPAYDDLFINITHDVKTSLTVIRGHAQLMARAVRRGDVIERDALLQTLTVIDASANRISAELDGWIDGAGPDAG